MKSSVVRTFGLFASVLVAGAASAQTTQAVEWKVSDGGNGHWYLPVAERMSWAQARQSCVSWGGHLATITSEQENAFIGSLGSVGDYWLGGFQSPTACEPACDWRWVTDEPWEYSNWNPGQPDDAAQIEDVLAFYPGKTTWNDRGDGSDCPTCGLPGFIVEWSADCNADGIVDYGQIRSGQLADDNTNGIPDICETSITGVLPPSVPAQGGSTITINGRNFPAQPSVLVGGVAATNVVRVSDSRLTAVTPALPPGMAPLTVNGYTLPDAIYIRPECGSDLDQNGIVDAGDISIILLDFGQCYETPLAAPVSSEVPELLEAQPEAPRKR